MDMQVERTGLDGLLIVRCEVHSDERGWFTTWHRTDALAEVLGREPAFAQANHSRSHPGVLRGFHAEPWDKLVTVTSGTAFCAVADVRPGSATFAEVATFTLGDPPGQRASLFLAEGLANAFCVVGDDDVDYIYLVSAPWSPGVDKGAVAFNDPDLAVAWPLTDPIVSPADRANPTLRERVGDHPRLAR